MDLTIFSKNGFISITEQPAPRYIYVIKGTGTSQNATRNEGKPFYFTVFALYGDVLFSPPTPNDVT